MIKICPGCQAEFEAIKRWGYEKKFCSRKCANSRVFTEETNKLKSVKSKAFYDSLTVEDKQRRSEIISKAGQQSSLKKIQNQSFGTLGWGLKRRQILLEQDNCCSECRIEQEWNGKPLKFQLDHIDGDRANNTRENLRMICPNCHSQTETYGRCNKTKKVKHSEIIKKIDKGFNNHQICLMLGINPSKRSYSRLNSIREALIVSMA